MVSVSVPVPANVQLSFTVKVLPSAIVNVAELAGDVIVTLLILVAVAIPRDGVVRDGDVANTNEPEPVSSDITPASCADVVAAKTDKLLEVYTTVPPAPKAIDDVSVPVKVRVLSALSVLPVAIFKYPELHAAVNGSAPEVIN